MSLLSQNYLTRGFWGDEAWTSLISQLPYLQMLKTTAADFHPPGYYTIVEFVYKFLPPTEINTRLISIVFYLLTVLMVYKLASLSSTSEESGPTSEVNVKITESSSTSPEVMRKKRFWGLLSAIVVAVNPIFFTYAFEARNYTMFALAATGSVYFLIKLSDRFNWRLTIFFILFSTLGIYTHYYMFFILASHGLYLLLFDRKILVKMVGLYGIVAILYLPWIPFLASQIQSVGQNYWIGGIDKQTHFEAILRILGGEHQNTFRPWLFGLSVILLLTGIIQHVMRRRFEKPNLRQGFGRQAYLLIWFWAIVPFVLATLPGLAIDGVKLPFRPIFFWRYLIGSAVPLSMVIVHTAEKFPKYLFLASVGLMMILSVVIDLLTFSRYPYTFRQAYEEKVLPQISRGDKIVTVLPSFAEVLYYRNRNNLDNELIVLPEGIIQPSGKSLLDAYVANGVVTISDEIDGRYFELTPGPSIKISN